MARNKNFTYRKKSNSGSRSRRKGHDLERKLAKVFREELGFIYCKTSRQVSRLLDDCGVDLAVTGAMLDNIPYLVQAKSGYKKRRPKPDELFKYIREKLKENFPEEHSIHSTPILVFHYLDGRDDANFIVSLMYKDALQLLKDSIELKELKETLKNYFSNLSEAEVPEFVKKL